MLVFCCCFIPALNLVAQSNNSHLFLQESALGAEPSRINSSCLSQHLLGQTHGGSASLFEISRLLLRAGKLALAVSGTWVLRASAPLPYGMVAGLQSVCQKRTRQNGLSSI